MRRAQRQRVLREYRARGEPRADELRRKGKAPNGAAFGNNKQVDARLVQQGARRALDRIVVHRIEQIELQMTIGQPSLRAALEQLNASGGRGPANRAS